MCKSTGSTDVTVSDKETTGLDNTGVTKDPLQTQSQTQSQTKSQNPQTQTQSHFSPTHFSQDPQDPQTISMTKRTESFGGGEGSRNNTGNGNGSGSGGDGSGSGGGGSGGGSGNGNGNSGNNSGRHGHHHHGIRSSNHGLVNEGNWDDDDDSDDDSDDVITANVSGNPHSTSILYPSCPCN